MDRTTVAWIIAGFLLGAGACANNDRGAVALQEAGVPDDASAPEIDGAEIDDAGGDVQDASVADSRGRSFDPLACPDAQPKQPVSCGGQLCPPPSKEQNNPCFVPCCLQVEGQEVCGLAGTAPAFTTGCTLPATPDLSCDQVTQFEGCCDLTQHKCGIIGGFAPGCQTTSRFVTLPKDPKSCGLDGGAGIDGGAGPDGAPDGATDGAADGATDGGAVTDVSSVTVGGGG